MCLDGVDVLWYKEPINHPLTLNWKRMVGFGTKMAQIQPAGLNACTKHLCSQQLVSNASSIICLDGDNELLYKEPINLCLTLKIKRMVRLVRCETKLVQIRPAQFWTHRNHLLIYFSQQSVSNSSSMMCLDGDNELLYKEPINLHLTLNLERTGVFGTKLVQIRPAVLNTCKTSSHLFHSTISFNCNLNDMFRWRWCTVIQGTNQSSHDT